MFNTPPPRCALGTEQAQIGRLGLQVLFMSPVTSRAFLLAELPGWPALMPGSMVACLSQNLSLGLSVLYHISFEGKPLVFRRLEICAECCTPKAFCQNDKCHPVPFALLGTCLKLLSCPLPANTSSLPTDTIKLWTPCQESSRRSGVSAERMWPGVITKNKNRGHRPLPDLTAPLRKPNS